MTPKFNGDFLVQEYFSGKTFMKILSVVLWAVAKRQSENMSFLAEVMKSVCQTVNLIYLKI